uniref:Uncharacterized protein n=1 Tax=Lotus japonicus TaxID=34305 RepID=I3T0K4_LOTJA|nr:unknown [Lotus japonicus]
MEDREGVFDSAHGGDDVRPRFVTGGAGEFVADEEVADEGFPVEGYDVGLDPVVGECLVGGDVGDEFVRDHDGDLDVCVFEGFEDFWICVVDFDALCFQGFDEIHRGCWWWKIVTQLTIVHSWLT